MDYNQLSVDLHKKFKGKLETKSKIPVTNKDELSVAYTPGVAAVSSEIGKDRSLAKTYTLKANTVAIVSDGSAILGLGNLGPEAAIPVMEGKAILFKQFAGVDAFPICLNRQDTEEIIKAVKYIAPVFGGINLEDIAAPRCFEIERRLKAELDIPVMHDDQHGTATVVLAALINALKVTNRNERDVKIVINGAGAAGMAIINLLLEYGVQSIIACDSKGIISKNRTDLDDIKQEIASRTNLKNKTGDLAVAMQGADVFIGVSKGDVLTQDMIRSMHQQAIVFVMANPIPEIMPDEAKEAGAFIVATGRSDFPNQINNVLAFPGIFRGALDNNIKQITSGMLIAAAKALAMLVKNPTPKKIIPSPFEEGIASTVAGAVKN